MYGAWGCLLYTSMLLSLTLSLYTPSNYILPSRVEKYASLNHEGKNHLTQVGREQGIRRLMSINLLKRLESSVYSFRLTLERIQAQIRQTLDTISRFDPSVTVELDDTAGYIELDADDQETDLFTVGRKVKIELADMDLSLIHILQCRLPAKRHPTSCAKNFWQTAALLLSLCKKAIPA